MLGIQVETLNGDKKSMLVSGWNEAERNKLRRHHCRSGSLFWTLSFTASMPMAASRRSGQRRAHVQQQQPALSATGASAWN